MDLQHYVRGNHTVIQFIKDAIPGENVKYIGTLDYATARFNTILLRLSEDPLKADQHKQEVQECFEIIQDFYSYTKKITTKHKIFKPIIRLILHYKGTIHIPKIKFLLEKVNN